MILYKTIKKAGSVEQIIQGSRFIAYISPVSTKEEGEQFIGSIRKKHKDATHNVPAMVLGEKFQVQWASDDGEPQGTSGAPMVHFLVSQGITNVAIVVTRYFGGTKLGTGGLVRAYTSSAKLALEAVGVVEVEKKVLLRLQVEYSFFEPIKRNFQIDDKNSSRGYIMVEAQSKEDGEEKRATVEIRDFEYLEKINMTVIVGTEYLEQVKKIISETTMGSGNILSIEEKNI